MLKRFLLAASAFLLALAVQGGLGQAWPAYASHFPKPHRVLATPALAPGEPANTQYAQAVAKSGGVRTDDVNIINGVDMKLAHVDVASQIIAPALGSSYSYSIGAYTSGGYWLQMGYIVLGSDGNGLARRFVQVLKPDGTTHYWNLSRAGTTNPPPACSACSGGSTDGYPFGFNSIMQGAWTFYFDGLTVARVKLGASNTTLRSDGIYFIAELTGHDLTISPLQPRVALRTLTLWSNAQANWRESAAATAHYFCSGVSICSGFGIEHPPDVSVLPNRIKTAPDSPLYPDGCYPAGNHPGNAHMSGAGASSAANPLWAAAGDTLWSLSPLVSPCP